MAVIAFISDYKGVSTIVNAFFCGIYVLIKLDTSETVVSSETGLAWTDTRITSSIDMVWKLLACTLYTILDLIKKYFLYSIRYLWYTLCRWYYLSIEYSLVSFKSTKRTLYFEKCRIRLSIWCMLIYQYKMHMVKDSFNTFDF